MRSLTAQVMNENSVAWPMLLFYSTKGMRQGKNHEWSNSCWWAEISELSHPLDLLLLMTKINRTGEKTLRILLKAAAWYFHLEIAQGRANHDRFPWKNDQVGIWISRADLSEHTAFICRVKCTLDSLFFLSSFFDSPCQTKEKKTEREREREKRNCFVKNWSSACISFLVFCTFWHHSRILPFFPVKILPDGWIGRKRRETMVLKNFVRYLINKFLKDYIEEFDYERLKLDLKHGKRWREKIAEQRVFTWRSSVFGTLASQSRSSGSLIDGDLSHSFPFSIDLDRPEPSSDCRHWFSR